MINLKISFACLGLGSSLLLLPLGGPKPEAQDDTSRLHVNVDLVQLSVAVTDKKGNYIAGLRPDDFLITEDKIQEKIATFEEGSGRLSLQQHRRRGCRPDSGETEKVTTERVTPIAGANVFILFDTSNYMYRGFVYAQDAIADFVRSLDSANRIAFYSYSRNLSRGTLLTADRFRVVNGVRSTVAGDDAALYNCLLLTVKDASQLTGRKAIVVFSNGPDNASSVPPGGRGGTCPVHRHPHLHREHEASERYPGICSGIRAGEQGHRGKGLFCEQLARRETGLFRHSRGHFAPLHDQLLSSGQPQPWLAHDQRETGGQEHAALSHPDARRLPAAATYGPDDRELCRASDADSLSRGRNGQAERLSFPVL